MTESNFSAGTAHVNSLYFFHHWAGEHLKAADVLPREQPYQRPASFLYCRSIELCLKAFLKGAGASLDDLKHKYGHNLHYLLNEAEKNGLAGACKLSVSQRKTILAANDYYLGKKIEYPDIGELGRGYSDSPGVDELQAAATALHKGLADYAIRRGNPGP